MPPTTSCALTVDQLCPDCIDSNDDISEEDENLLCEIAEGDQHNFKMIPFFIGGWDGVWHTQVDCGLCTEAHNYSRFTSCESTEAALELLEEVQYLLGDGRDIMGLVAEGRTRLDRETSSLHFVGCGDAVVGSLPLTAEMVSSMAAEAG